MKYFTPIILLLFIISGCSKEELFGEQVRHDLWLIHEGAKLPVVVEGNTQSKIFVILLHGGPGSSAQLFNAEMKAFTDPLEEDYAMVYYDQRNAGLALGDWDEEKLTIEQHIEDLDMVVDLLYHRFDDEIKIFLAGHSWGGYLGIGYLIDENKQDKIKAWININGLTHRNFNQKHALDRIDTLGQEQISNGVNTSDWTTILGKVQSEKDKSINPYNVETEDNVFDLIRLAEAQINKDNLLEYNFNSPFSSIYNDNYDPFRLIINGNRDEGLQEQMYVFDDFLDMNLENILVPSLSIYGYYDVRTPIQQAEYFLNGITTLEDDKDLIILENSGHESPKNEPLIIAEEIKVWIEKYK